ncbi:response regulator transcription factor [Dehalobacter sp. DCM]|uniref:response regulator transcription factor n=1 Tax=Dehalobacter sp. DCM TaxID=2907827 RepID=UPI0030812FFA|nr:response regulator transcription factor [Dehalobacter sp. DCM]
MDAERKEIINVLIVDDHTLFAEGTLALLSGDERIQVLGITKSGQECINFITQTPPDVILLDIFLPDTYGTDLVEKIKEVSPNTKILMLTGQNPHGFINRSIRVGAHGFMIKDCSARDMIDGIIDVHHGGLFFSPIPGVLMDDEDGESHVQREKESKVDEDSILTPKENMIMHLISQGLHNKDIAMIMGKRTRLIDFQVGNIFLKLGVDTRLEAIVKWAEIEK